MRFQGVSPNNSGLAESIKHEDMHLCTPCNTGLGKLGDTREGLLAALRYLDGEPTGS